MKAPDKIYLQYTTDPEIESTWCDRRITENDVEYIRADLHHQEQIKGKDETLHQFKRDCQEAWIRAWTQTANAIDCKSTDTATRYADAMLEEFKSRFKP